MEKVGKETYARSALLLVCKLYNPKILLVIKIGKKKKLRGEERRAAAYRITNRAKEVDRLLCRFLPIRGRKKKEKKGV